ncbi:hypothetical protein [Pacificibacter sp.]|uniref:dioxygenase family protein n=1 Tax=Pacificibacter sp. TaxID=1917866 RepID=UPI0032197285
MTIKRQTRREILASGMGGLVATTAHHLYAATLTPGATEGPFYPTPSMRRTDVDNDLVKIVGAVREAGGDVITLIGRVLEKDGAPLAERRIEIWRCNISGKYPHSGDRQNIGVDAAFKSFGYNIKGPDDGYVFRRSSP